MRITKPLYGQRRDPAGIGPWFAFAAAIMTASVIWTGLIAAIPAGLAVPIAVTLLFGFAAGLVLLSRLLREDATRITYADVAGALTLIGLCAAATIDPEQLARIVASDATQP